MPVLDHATHPTTIGSERYDACREKKPAPGYWAPDLAHRADGKPPMRKWSYIPNVASESCRYDQSWTDPKCEGCPQRGFGEEYDRKVRSMDQ